MAKRSRLSSERKAWRAAANVRRWGMGSPGPRASTSSVAPPAAGRHRFRHFRRSGSVLVERSPIPPPPSPDFSVSRCTEPAIAPGIPDAYRDGVGRCRMRQAAQKRPPRASRGGWPARGAEGSAPVDCLLFLRPSGTKTATKYEPHQNRHGSCKGVSAAGSLRRARTTDLQGGASDFSEGVWWFAPDHTPLAGRSCRSRRPHFFLRARSREPAGTGIEGAAGWHEPCFPAQ